MHHRPSQTQKSKFYFLHPPGCEDLLVMNYVNCPYQRGCVQTAQRRTAVVQKQPASVYMSPYVCGRVRSIVATADPR